MSTDTSQTTQNQSAKPTANLSESERLEQGRAVIRNNVYWALGAGVVPIPLFDVVAVLGVEVKMLKQLSDVYGVKFSEDIAKKLATSLLASLGSVGLGVVVGGSLLKFIPVVGQALGVVSVPVIAAAFTHAMGTVFLMHFETGGTLLNFDPAAVRSHFKREFDKAKIEISQIHDKAKPAQSATVAKSA